jgi:hypothetical protein
MKPVHQLIDHVSLHIPDRDVNQHFDESKQVTRSGQFDQAISLEKLFVICLDN